MAAVCGILNSQRKKKKRGKGEVEVKENYPERVTSQYLPLPFSVKDLSIEQYMSILTMLFTHSVFFIYN